MGQTKETDPDWIHSPAGCDVLSLWACLHDGELLSCESDPVERNVTLRCRVDHLLDDPDDPARFVLRLDRVTSVRANVSFRWPGGVSIPETATREEECRLIDEYWAKFREESVSWSVFESSVAAEPLQIYEAELARGEDQLTLKLGGFLDGEPFDHLYCWVFIRGGDLTVARSDGQPFSLEEFLLLGEEFWNTLGDAPVK